jgi:hypothetical protein
VVGAVFGLVAAGSHAVGGHNGDTVRNPAAIFTLSAMLGLFAYVYWLAGTEDRQMDGLDANNCMNTDATVTPHESRCRHADNT